MGPAVITWADLAAWCSLTQVSPAPWEANAIIRLGNVRAVVMSERAPGQE